MADRYTEEERSEMAEQIRLGDVSLIEKLWADIDRFASWTINQVLLSPYWREQAEIAGLEFDELKSEAFLIFSRSVGRFRNNPEKGQSFTTFIYYRFFYDTKSYIKKRASHQCLSLDAPVGGEDEDLLLIDAIEDPDSMKPFDHIARRDYNRRLRADLDFVLMKLPEKQRDVLVARYYQQKPVEDVARDLKLRKNYVVQLTAEGLEALRNSPELEQYRPARYKAPEEKEQNVSHSWARAMLDEEE